MTPEERYHLKRLIARIRQMNESEAHCFCGRHYRLMFDMGLQDELDVAESIIDAMKVSYLEVD